MAGDSPDRGWYGAQMTHPVLLCTDGSDAALAALRAGLAVIDPASSLMVVVVAPEPDPTLVTGSGMAGGVLSAEAYDLENAAALEEAHGTVVDTQRELGLEGGEARVVLGEAGSAICHLALEISAAAIVMGTRGRGGLRRAVLGSVSDHVVRNAHCPVIVSGGQVETPAD